MFSTFLVERRTTPLAAQTKTKSLCSGVPALQSQTFRNQKSVNEIEAPLHNECK